MTETSLDREITYYRTVFVLVFVFAISGILLQKDGLIYIACLLMALQIFLKKAAFAVAEFWLRISHILGVINTRILLALVFILFLIPLALLFRALRGDFMNIRNKPRDSSWHELRHTYVAADLEKPW